MPHNTIASLASWSTHAWYSECKFNESVRNELMPTIMREDGKNICMYYMYDLFCIFFNKFKYALILVVLLFPQEVCRAWLISFSSKRHSITCPPRSHFALTQVVTSSPTKSLDMHLYIHLSITVWLTTKTHTYSTISVQMYLTMNPKPCDIRPMCLKKHTYMHTYIPMCLTYIYKIIHAQIHTYIHTYKEVCTLLLSACRWNVAHSIYQSIIFWFC